MEPLNRFSTGRTSKDFGSRQESVEMLFAHMHAFQNLLTLTSKITEGHLLVLEEISGKVGANKRKWGPQESNPLPFLLES